MLLMDIKGAFDHVSGNCQLCITEDMEADGDLMRWTESYISDKMVGLVIDGHQCEETAMDTCLPPGSSVSPIPFTIHLSKFFKMVEKEEKMYGDVVCRQLRLAGDSRHGGAAV